MNISVSVKVTIPREKSFLSNRAPEIIGPFEAGDFICITDAIGFGAVKKSSCPKTVLRSTRETSDSNVRNALKIVNHANGTVAVDVPELLKWLSKARKYVIVYGCFLNSDVLFKWLSRSPQTDCTVVRHKFYSGHFLVFIGKDWRVSVAGLARNGIEKDAAVWPMALREQRKRLTS